jgi:hypothetical protein
MPHIKSTYGYNMSIRAFAPLSGITADGDFMRRCRINSRAAFSQRGWHG